MEILRPAELETPAPVLPPLSMAAPSSPGQGQPTFLQQPGCFVVVLFSL